MSRISKFVSFFLSLLFLLVPLCTQTDLGLQIEQPYTVVAEATQSSYFEPLVSIKMTELQHLTPILSENCEYCLEEPPPIPAKVEHSVFVAKKPAVSLGIERMFSPDIWDTYLYFKEAEEKESASLKPADESVNTALNSLYIKVYVDEKTLIRDLWRQALGIDVWYPYFKAKDVERWVKKRMSFKVFKTKCSPKFEKNSFIYTCKSRF